MSVNLFVVSSFRYKIPINLLKMISSNRRKRNQRRFFETFPNCFLHDPLQPCTIPVIYLYPRFSFFQIRTPAIFRYIDLCYLKHYYLFANRIAPYKAIEILNFQKKIRPCYTMYAWHSRK